MTVSIDKHLSLHANALTLRSQRTKLLANNLANADTPNYKARDIDFSSMLKQQISGPHTATLATTHAAHMPMNGTLLASTLKYRVPQEPSLDGNTVDTDVEQGEFTENSVRYQASLEFLSRRIRRMISVLKGE